MTHLILFLGIGFLFFIIYVSYYRQEARYRLRKGELHKGIDAALKSFAVEESLLEPLKKKWERIRVEDIEEISREEKIILLKYLYYRYARYGEVIRGVNFYLLAFTSNAEDEMDHEILELASRVSPGKDFSRTLRNRAERLKRRAG